MATLLPVRSCNGNSGRPTPSLISSIPLNKDIHHIRLALGDNPDNPVYLETVARHGYRFIHPVEVELGNLSSNSGPSTAPMPVPGTEVHIGPGQEEALRQERKLSLLRRANLVIRRLIPSRRKAALIALAILIAAALTSEFYLRHRTVSEFPQIRSLAVLPFKVQGDNPDQENLALGLTDALISEIGQIPSLRVISLPTMMNYRQTPKTATQIARELRVDGVIQGSVRQAGEWVIVSVQLAHASDGDPIWESSYEMHSSGTMGLREQVTYDILQQLKLNVIQETKEGKAAGQSVDPEAYRSYLMGRFHRYQMTQDFGKDILFFKRSIEKDPSFAEPYAAMAVSYVLQCIASKISPQEAFTQAKAAAQKALELDPNLAEAHAALGVVNFGFNYDWAGGRQELQKALELKPNSAEININYAWYLVMTGHFEEAIAKNLKAIDLDPLNPVNNFSYGWTCLMARRYDEGIEFTKKLQDHDPLYPHARLRLSELYAAKGMHKEALEGIDQIEKSQTPFLAWVYAVSGEPGKSRALLAELEERRKHEYLDAIFLARGFAGLGERDKAFAWLETAFKENSPHLVTLKVFPGFDGLRSDPRYWNLLNRIGLGNEIDE